MQKRPLSPKNYPSPKRQYETGYSLQQMLLIFLSHFKTYRVVCGQGYNKTPLQNFKGKKPYYANRYPEDRQ